MTVLYFAWLRQRIGAASETLTPPVGVDTVGALMAWLSARSPGHAAAFADPARIRAAVNQEHAARSATIRADDEVAFFPPVTGG